MVFYEYAIEIIEGLLRKTRQDQVKWLASETASDTFFVRFPKSRVEIDFCSPSASADFDLVTYYNKYNVEVKTLRVEEEEGGWQTLQELFDEVSRVMLEWDKVLKELKHAVQVPGLIGS